MTKPLLALSLVALAVACTQSPPPPVTSPPNPSAIARLEVTPAALLLTQQGQKQVLSVKAFNSSGAEVTATYLGFLETRAGQRQRYGRTRGENWSRRESNRR